MIIYRLGSLSVSFVLMGSLVSGCALLDSNVKPSVTSSYACQSTPVEGMAIEGSGAYGCYFYLLDPATKQVLTNAPYQLTLYAPPSSSSAKERGKKSVPLRREGVTDSQGRSFFVKSATPITPGRMQIVQSVGDGGNGASFRLVRPQDGKSMPNVAYEISGCAREYRGRTDEQGYTVLVNCKKQSEVHVEYFDEQGYTVLVN